MKFLKLTLLLLTFILSATSLTWVVAMAQTPPGATTAPLQLTEEQKMERRIEHLEHMQKRLGLTDEQVAQIKTVWQANRAKLIADRQAMENASGREKRLAHRMLNQDRKATMSQIKGILTPEQQRKFADIQEIRRERRIERRMQHK